MATEQLAIPTNLDEAFLTYVFIQKIPEHCPRSKYRKKLEQMVSEILCKLECDERFAVGQIGDILKIETKDDAFSLTNCMASLNEMEDYALMLAAMPWKKEFKTVKLSSSNLHLKIGLHNYMTIFFLLGYVRNNSDEDRLDLCTYPDVKWCRSIAFNLFLATIECAFANEVWKDNDEGYSEAQVMQARMQSGGGRINLLKRLSQNFVPLNAKGDKYPVTETAGAYRLGYSENLTGYRDVTDVKVRYEYPRSENVVTDRSGSDNFTKYSLVERRGEHKRAEDVGMYQLGNVDNGRNVRMNEIESVVSPTRRVSNKSNDFSLQSFDYIVDDANNRFEPTSTNEQDTNSHGSWSHLSDDELYNDMSLMLTNEQKPATNNIDSGTTEAHLVEVMKKLDINGGTADDNRKHGLYHAISNSSTRSTNDAKSLTTSSRSNDIQRLQYPHSTVPSHLSGYPFDKHPSPASYPASYPYSTWSKEPVSESISPKVDDHKSSKSYLSETVSSSAKRASDTRPISKSISPTPSKNAPSYNKRSSGSFSGSSLMSQSKSYPNSFHGELSYPGRAVRSNKDEPKSLKYPIRESRSIRYPPDYKSLSILQTDGSTMKKENREYTHPKSSDTTSCSPSTRGFVSRGANNDILKTGREKEAWICPICTFKNDKNFSICHNTGCSGRPNKYSSGTSSNNDKLKIGREKEAWSCPHCTFENEKEAFVCHGCFKHPDNDILEIDSEKDAWICPKCTLKNKKHTIVCRACFELRPPRESNI